MSQDILYEEISTLQASLSSKMKWCGGLHGIPVINLIVTAKICFYFLVIAKKWKKEEEKTSQKNGVKASPCDLIMQCWDMLYKRQEDYTCTGQS